MTEPQDAKPPSQSKTTLSMLMGPGHANVLGNVHGGSIMKLCDEAGGMAATKHARCQVVTVAVDSMAFHSSVHIGDILTVTAIVTWTGRTSLETRVVVTAEDVLSGRVEHTNTAYFVYVALDRHGRPTAVPPLELTTDEERETNKRAAARQAHRLQTRERSSE